MALIQSSIVLLKRLMASSLLGMAVTVSRALPLVKIVFSLATAAKRRTMLTALLTSSAN